MLNNFFGEGMSLALNVLEIGKINRGEPTEEYVNFESSLSTALCFTHTMMHVLSPHGELV